MLSARIRNSTRIANNCSDHPIENIVNISSRNEIGRVLVDFKSPEMSLATVNFCTLFISQIIDEKTALCLDDEVQLLGSFLLHENRPVGVVAAKRRRDGEPTRQLGVHLDGAIILELVSEAALGV